LSHKITSLYSQTTPLCRFCLQQMGYLCTAYQKL